MTPSPHDHPEEPIVAPLVHRIVVVVVLVVLAFVAHLSATATPEALPADASMERFAAGRALEHLRFIASAPRPVGSAHHDAVRDHLRATLAGLGLEVEVREQIMGGLQGRRHLVVARVQNVVARVRGRSGGRGAILLVAHYDTVASGPGAGDNGAAVAALLEAARVLAANPPEHDVVLLFSDAEEVGLYGASAFVEGHPAAEEVRLVLDFEARGTGGPSLLFETTPDNAGLIEAYADLPTPIGSTLAHEVYRYLPHRTDVNVFAERGLPAMNFGFIEGAIAYHTARDDVARLDPRSLQHHGESMVALVRRFDGVDLAHLPPGTTVFFPLPGLVARYPLEAVLPFALLAALITGVAVVIGVRKGALRASKLLTAAPLHGLLALLTGGVGLAGWWGAAVGFAEVRDQLLGTPWNGAWIVATLGAFGVTLQLAASARLSRVFRTAEQTAGVLVAWSAVALALAVFIPGAAYLVTWPVLVTALATAARWWTGPAPNRATTSALLGAGASLNAALLAPTVVGAWVATLLPGATLTLLVLGLLCGLSLPLLHHLQPRHPWRLPALSAVVTVVLGAVALTTLGATAERPRPASLSYLLDADTHRAWWLSSDEAPNAWNAPALTSPIPASGFGVHEPSLRTARLSADAPPLDLPTPQLAAEERLEGLTRARLLPHRADALVLTLHLDSPARLQQLVLGGYEVPAHILEQPAPLDISFWAPGAELPLTVLASSPSTGRLSTLAPDVPPPFDRRPDDVICRPFWPRLSCVTVVSRTIEVP